MKKTKNILVCPLDWGLGHASRMVPIIDLLINNKANVIIAADNQPLEFLKNRFPKCEFIKFPGFEPKYPKGKSMALKMAVQFPKMKKQAKKSKLLLENIIETKQIDIVISDNRYELFSKKAKCIFITHQLNIRTNGFHKLFKWFVDWQVRTYVSKFDELWIPDFENKPWLSAELSHGKKIPLANHTFIGPLSRFANMDFATNGLKFDVLLILSGPEPQRSIFGDIIENQLKKTHLSVAILLGKPDSFTNEKVGNIQKFTHLPDFDFANLVMNSELIISRPGYSSLMDLAVFGKPAFFVPTPGQTEQEYLAESLMEQKLFYSQKQSKIDIEQAIVQIKKYRGIKLTNDYSVLNKRIDTLLAN